MSMERGAWSREPEGGTARVGVERALRREESTGRITAGRTSHLGRGSSARWGGGAAGGTAAFSLLEMLFVIGIIAVLMALTVPAIQGLVGATGKRGAVGVVLTTLDQARAAAIENGTDVYVGFPPPNFQDPNASDTAFRSLLVFRSPKDDEQGFIYKPLSRWITLPKGTLISSAGANLEILADVQATELPRLAGKPVSPRAIRYDRFGRIRNSLPVNGQMSLEVGEGLVADGQFEWKGDNRTKLKAQRLTGRWVVEGSTP